MAAHPEHAISPLSDLHMKLAGDNRHLLAPTHAPLLYTALQAGEHTTIVQQLLTHRVLDVDCKVCYYCLQVMPCESVRMYT